jgi:hypothetical protein
MVGVIDIGDRIDVVYSIEVSLITNIDIACCIP